MLLPQFLLTFLHTHTPPPLPKKKKGGGGGVLLLMAKSFYFFPVDWEGLYDDLRYVSWEDIFELVAFTVASEIYFLIFRQTEYCWS